MTWYFRDVLNTFTQSGGAFMAHERKGKGPSENKDLNMEQTGQGLAGRNYGEKEIKTVLGRGDFQSWNDVINWLDRNGSREIGLNAQSVHSLRQDFQRLQDQGANFTTDPTQVVQMISRQGR
jgi:hypothetical protein